MGADTANGRDERSHTLGDSDRTKGTLKTPTSREHDMSASGFNPGWGSFATVSIGHPVAFKHVIVRERTVEVKTEFEALRSLFVSVDGSPPLESRRRACHSLVSEGDFKLLELDNAAYDHVLPIPLSTAKAIRTLFYPPNMPHALDPTLCRLYFGKVIQELGPGGRPNRFFNSANFALDVSRYRKLLEVVVAGNCVYPSVEDIVHGMGEMLGHMHWRAGYDGRDVEFIMHGLRDEIRGMK